MSPESTCVVQANKIDLGRREPTIRIDDIVRIEGAENYSMIYTVQKTYLITKTLKYFELSIENSYFLRVHKSHIVNMKHVVKENNKEEYHSLVTSDGEEIRVSRRKTKTVKKYYEK